MYYNSAAATANGAREKKGLYTLKHHKRYAPRLTSQRGRQIFRPEIFQCSCRQQAASQVVGDPASRQFAAMGTFPVIGARGAKRSRAPPRDDDPRAPPGTYLAELKTMSMSPSASRAGQVPKYWYNLPALASPAGLCCCS